MPAPHLTIAQLDVIHRRALHGEPTATLAREFGVKLPALHLRLQRRYGFKGSILTAQSIVIPDDPGVRAYIAGIVDGEGSLSYMHGTAPRLQVAMTCKEIIDWLGTMGGRTYSRSVRGERKPIYVWSLIPKRDLAALLSAVLPSMKVKRELAASMLADLTEAQERIPMPHDRGTRLRRLTPPAMRKA